jgi:hypothetical protein
MSAQDDEVGKSAGSTPRAAEQSDRAAGESNEAGSYRAERYPEDPGTATPPLDSRQAPQPPGSD